MRTETITLYKFEELSDDAKEKARQWWRDIDDGEPDTSEIADSLKALFEKAGIELTDWCLGAYNRNNFVKFNLGDAEDLSGKRAIAWLENNLFGRLRVYKTWKDEPGRARYKGNRAVHVPLKDAIRYGYKIGAIPDCPLTGVCFDEDLIDDLRKSIREGNTLKEAFRGLADKAGQMMEEANEYRNADEQVDESLIINEYEFTEDGKRA